VTPEFQRHNAQKLRRNSADLDAPPRFTSATAPSPLHDDRRPADRVAIQHAAVEAGAKDADRDAAAADVDEVEPAPGLGDECGDGHRLERAAASRPGRLKSLRGRGGKRAGRAFHVLALPELDPRHHAALDDAIDLGRAAAADELANLDLLSRRGLARIDQLEIGAGFELRGGNGEFQIGVYDDLLGCNAAHISLLSVSWLDPTHRATSAGDLILLCH